MCGRLKPKKNPTIKELDVIEKGALEITHNGEIQMEDNGSYVVKYKTRSYRLIIEEPQACTCSYFVWFGKNCKHLWAVMLSNEVKTNLEVETSQEVQVAAKNIQNVQVLTGPDEPKRKRRSGVVPVEASQRKNKKNKTKKTKFFYEKPLDDVECEALGTELVSSRGRIIKRRKVMDL